MILKILYVYSPSIAKIVNTERTIVNIVRTLKNVTLKKQFHVLKRMFSRIHV